MKKALVLVLILSVIMLCSVAMADSKLTNWKQLECPFQQPDGSFDHDEWKPIVTFDIPYTAHIYAELYLEDEFFSKMQIAGDNGIGTVHAGTVTLLWNGVNTNGWHPNPEAGYVDFNVKVYFNNGVLIGTYGFEYAFAHTISQHNKETWYPNNTANSFGPQVKGDWQTYSAVDLSVQGTQRFDLIGAGAWKLGTVSVTVDGDNVVVEYLMDEDINTRDTWDDISVESEYLNIFCDAEAIDLSATSTYKFGTPISIANDLGGDTTVALIVINKVDYPSHSPYVTRFWPNMAENKAIVEAMNTILAQ